MLLISSETNIQSIYRFPRKQEVPWPSGTTSIAEQRAYACNTLQDADFSLIVTETRCKSWKKRKTEKRKKENRDHGSISLQLVTVDPLASVFGKSWTRQHTPQGTRWISVNPQWSRRVVTGLDKQSRFLDTANRRVSLHRHLGVSMIVDHVNWPVTCPRRVLSHGSTISSKW